MSFKNFSRILDDAKYLDFKKIQLSGGEPFQHPEIDEFI
jgi:organic radical activating enzyme